LLAAVLAAELSMADDDVRPILIKKKKVVDGGGHHGGAWKVAYADFVTAMMAFFLLMWLLNATSEEQRKGLADYFNPDLPISRTSAGGAGMLKGEELFTEKAASGNRKEGVPPKPTHQEPGEPLDDEAASPDAPPGKEAAHGGPAKDEGDGTSDLNPDEAAALAEEKAEQARLEEISRQLAEAVRKAEDGTLEDHFLLRLTPEGLVIEIVDANEEPLFASASAEPTLLLRALIDVLVPVLAETTNGIAVVGHTDAVPFGGARYSNWELSADRANSARRLLTADGLPKARIKRVTGKAAVEPLLPDAKAPQNRRIAITLLRNHAR
jgi:chemotaxis protein MotB